jgi:hypothetical protein
VKIDKSGKAQLSVTWKINGSEEDTTMAELLLPSLKPFISEIFSLLRVRDETVSVAEKVRGFFLSFSMPLRTYVKFLISS